MGGGYRCPSEPHPYAMQGAPGWTVIVHAHPFRGPHACTPSSPPACGRSPLPSQLPAARSRPRRLHPPLPPERLPPPGPPAWWDDGVVRDAETGPYVEVSLPDGVKRTIFFDKDGSFLSFSTAQADGTAAMKVSSRREGDTTLAMLGDERYEIPDVLIQGD